MPSRLQFSFQSSTSGARNPEAHGRPANPATHLNVIVLSDLTGGSSRPPAASTRARRIDLDSFDERFEAAGVCIPAALAGAPADVTLESLDAMHPDELYRDLPVFAKFRAIRKRLRDPATFEAAAEELTSAGLAVEAAPAAAPAETATPSREGATDGGSAGDESDQDTLSRLLGASDATAAPTDRPAGGDAIETLIGSLVAPHVEHEPSARLTAYLQAIEMAMAARMTEILSAPGFRRAEASWRSLERLVKSVEWGEAATLHVLDVAANELAGDAGTALAALDRSCQAISADADGAPCEWLVAIDPGLPLDNIETFTSIARWAAAAGVPVLIDAASELAGSPGWAAAPDPASWAAPAPLEADAWTGFRRTPSARWLAGVAPRVLLRLPYGPDGEPFDGFTFDELGAASNHGLAGMSEQLRWGSGAVAAALLVARAFVALTEGGQRDLELSDLPAYVFDDDGDRRLVPGAEANLSERTVERLLELGLSPFASFKNRNAVRLVRLQSLAAPLAPLEGVTTRVF